MYFFLRAFVTDHAQKSVTNALCAVHNANPGSGWQLATVAGTFSAIEIVGMPKGPVKGDPEKESPEKVKVREKLASKRATDDIVLMLKDHVGAHLYEYVYVKKPGEDWYLPLRDIHIRKDRVYRDSTFEDIVG
jgi:hypothetical protein